VNRIRIVLADDHVVVRQGLRSLINQQKDMLVIGEADDGLQLLQTVEELHPDVALVDLKMPNMNGIDAAGEIRKRFPDTHIVILSMHSDRAYIERALQAGVSGYVLKEENFQEMCAAIRHAAQGVRYLSAGVSGQTPATLSTGETHPNLISHLTSRERQVFQLVAEGKTNNEIAELFGISVRTVEGHRAKMMVKLGLKTHVDFARFALKQGILVEE
jgi:two-component system, NarL family, response regulator NreC